MSARCTFLSIHFSVCNNRAAKMERPLIVKSPPWRSLRKAGVTVISYCLTIKSLSWLNPLSTSALFYFKEYYERHAEPLSMWTFLSGDCEGTHAKSNQNVNLHKPSGFLIQAEPFHGKYVTLWAAVVGKARKMWLLKKNDWHLFSD